jgi:hypothetical protein
MVEISNILNDLLALIWMKLDLRDNSNGTQQASPVRISKLGFRIPANSRLEGMIAKCSSLMIQLHVLQRLVHPALAHTIQEYTPLANRSTQGSRQRLLVLMTIYSLGKGYPMILFGKKHLHVSESDQIVDSLLKFLKVTSGSVKLEVANQPY